VIILSPPPIEGARSSCPVNRCGFILVYYILEGGQSLMGYRSIRIEKVWCGVIIKGLSIMLSVNKG